MALRQALALCLLCLGVAAEEQYAAVSGDVQPGPSSAKLATCQFSKKELHTTVRSAAVSALTGICDPVEMETRLLAIEQRLGSRIEELKQTLIKLFIDGVAYDYDEEGDSALEQHRYTGADAAASAAVRNATVTAAGGSDAEDDGAGAADGEARLTQHGGFEAYNRVETADDARRLKSLSSDLAARRTAASAGAGISAGGGSAAGAQTAGVQQAGSRAGSSRSYSYKFSSSSRSRGSSADSADAEAGAGEASGVVVSSEDAAAAAAAAEAARRHGSRRTSSSYHWKTSSPSSRSSTGSSGGVTGEGGSEVGAAIGAANQEQSQDRGSSSSGAAQEEVGVSGAPDAGTSASAGDGASVAAGAQNAGSRSSSSRSYSYKRTASSRGSSGEGSADQTRGEAGATSSQEVGVDEEPGQHGGSRGSSTRRHSYERRTSSSRGSSGATAAGEVAQKARAIGGAGYSDGEDSQSNDSTRSGDGRYAYERRTSSSSSRGGASGDVSREDAQQARAIGGAGSNERRTSSQGSSRAIGGAGYSEGADSQYSGGSRSSSRRFSQERDSSSRGSSRDSSEEPPYVDFGPGGGPEQQTWFPGSSRTTVGTGVPDLSGSTSRSGGFGFGAVGESLDEDSSSSASSRAQVRTGGGPYTAGGGGVLFRDGQTYGSSAEARRPGSTAGGDSSQYAAQNASWASSGERQVSAYDASRASRQGGNEVRFLSSYTPTQRENAYSSFNNQQSRASNSQRSRQADSRSRTGRRRAWRRRQRVTDTVSSVSGEESTPLSRYREIDTYNDTVHEVDGKQRYTYYWEINDFPTMMTTWEHHHSLRSPSFYVYKGGYRMYIRVFPSRQGGNVYLHTGLTSGRYDDELVWPFQLKLRLSLLDHSNLQHDIRSRVWDPRKLCSGWNWKRPRHKDNFECVGLGFPQSLLETQRFLLDGAVLIKLDVFLED